MKRKSFVVIICVSILILAGVIPAGIVLFERNKNVGVTQLDTYEITEEGYRTISMNEAKELFDREGDYIILDVRREDEFAEGHIPGAINIPNEDIGYDTLTEIPDRGKVIFVYCRSGRRSKEASAKLASAGYTNVVECGGILDWTGETVK